LTARETQYLQVENWETSKLSLELIMKQIADIEGEIVYAK
jgi:hypothetical protein